MSSTAVKPLVVLCAATLLAAASLRGQGGGRRTTKSAAVTDQRQSVIVDAAARVAPAVVSVNVLRRQREMPNDPYSMFFMPRGYERKVEGYGSGFVISSDGVVITNQHVTSGAEQIVVTTREGTDYPAKVLGEDPLTDIAVLKIEGTGLPTAPLGASTDLVVGEWVVAIGNPFAYLLGNTEPSVTAGVVSAVGRNLLPSGDQTGVYVDMIQTDASINPGNSGGPLVDVDGRVVGVNSSILTPSGGSVGIGFAIPIERAVRVASELKRYGHVRRPWVGLDVAGTEDLRDWKKSGGLRVSSVALGGPAARAGMAAGDVLLNVQERSIHTFLDWEAVMLDTGPGDTVVVAYRRAERRLVARLAVTDLPTTVAEKVSILGGLQAITITPAIRQERGIQTEQGALIYQIGDDAQQATGLRPGDVIFQINRQAVRSAEDLKRLFGSSGGQPVTVWLERGGSVGRTTFYVQ
ncbi:MAG TPA: trypsin-like peptidase domain-containing protein [Gemmatimonadales bacterium]|nr:trypsin-like peptidase domain-containing protein [Gemmatimonadales bacterium]